MNSTVTKNEKPKSNRDKQLAILKAENQMLEDAKQTILEKIGNNGDTLIEQISTAQEENLNMGRVHLGASPNEIKNAEYGEPSKLEVEKYERHLKARKVSDAEMRRKDITVQLVEKEKKDGKLLKGFGDKVLTVVSGKKKKKVEDEEEVITKSASELFEGRTEKGLGYVEEESTKKVSSEKMNKQLVDIAEEIAKPIDEVPKVVETNTSVLDSFDPRDIPDYVQYDIIPLPSKGKCYPVGSPLRCGRIPVAYLTASDENLIASPNMYRDGLILDTIIKRKVLDKSINTDEIVKGDKDAIILWLRATAYGNELPVEVYNPNDRTKKYKRVADLSSFNYLPFDIESDENGYFDYKTDNGDIIKFGILNNKDWKEIEKVMREELVNESKVQVLENIASITESISINRDNIDINDLEILKESCSNITTWAETLPDKKETGNGRDEMYSEIVTLEMKKYTKSINGNADRNYIDKYIENMRAGEASKYRDYTKKNIPGVDFSIKIEIPEADGGGFFNTFLTYDDSIFLVK